MSNILEDIQCAGSDTRPPMLDRTGFASWQQRIRLYCQGKENGINILKSIDEGPFQMGTLRETLTEGTEGALHLGPERPRVYSDLTSEEKYRYNDDIRVTNILLQGLPKDIYSLINHYTNTKDIWDNVKMLLEGSELTKKTVNHNYMMTSNTFDKPKGETIHDYYVRFAKLINDMRNIKMTMSRMQLNSKFVNKMLLEWGRFVTAVKLNRGLRDSNYDQLYAYLKQHESIAMSNILEDIQCAGSDTRHPMLDRTGFASWQQRIRLYCWGKENGVNILKSIDEGPFQMGTLKETLTEGTEGALHLGPERPRVYSNLTSEEKYMYNADIRATNILLQGLPKDIYSLINHYTDTKDIWDNVKMLLEGSELTKEDLVKLNRGLRDSNYDQLYAYLKQHEHYPQSSTTSPSTYVQPHLADTTQLDSGLSPMDNLIKNLTNTLTYLPNHTKHTFLKQTINSELHQIRGTKPQFKTAGLSFRMFRVDKIKDSGTMHGVQAQLVMGGQDNVVDDDVDEKPIQDLALNVDNVFQADDYLFYDETGPSYDSDVLSEVHDHDHYQDAVCEHHEVHEMHDDVQPNYVVDSYTGYTSDSNMIPYDQYVKDNAVQVVQNDVSAVPNNAYMMILNDMHEPPVQHVHITTHNKVVDKSLTAELATYKE
nr:retrovirus-related Pol polyprotein from transposon TNT 1-94 [Tanacetum cinerariifolium]